MATATWKVASRSLLYAQWLTCTHFFSLLTCSLFLCRSNMSARTRFNFSTCYLSLSLILFSPFSSMTCFSHVEPLLIRSRLMLTRFQDNKNHTTSSKKDKKPKINFRKMIPSSPFLKKVYYYLVKRVRNWSRTKQTVTSFAREKSNTKCGSLDASENRVPIKKLNT